jgi:arylsulfatase A-like enzyme
VAWHEEERFHSDVFIGDSAEAWVKNYRGRQPFFLQVGLTGPHEPWDPLPRHLAMYKGRELPRPVQRAGEAADKPPQHQAHHLLHAQTDHESRIDVSRAGGAAIDHMRRHYYAKITTVDEQIGKVMAALAARGFLDNSLVIFCSDHGELLGDHTLSYKWLMYDPIVHVPLIICPPRQSNASPAPSVYARSVHDLVSLIDLGPTILAAAGIEIPDYLEGRSLIPYLAAAEQSKTITPRRFVFSEDNYQIMLRSETHKLIYYIGQTDGDLYDLQCDPDELWNLWRVPEHAATKNQLLQELLGWFTTSVYYNSAYKRERAKQERLRWPDAGDARLHGPNLRRKQVPWL